MDRRGVNRLGGLVVLAASAPLWSQFQPGDLIVNGYGRAPSIGHYRPDGALATMFTGTGAYWQGAALLPGGEIATTRRFPNGVNVFAPRGDETLTFDTPMVTLVPADISAFSDGVLAICDQAGDIDLYSDDGAYLTSFTAPGLSRGFGSYVDVDDHLWVCDPRNIGVDDGWIYKFNRDGELLLDFGLDFEPGDLVVDNDGTLWISDRNNRSVSHHTDAGQRLDGFPVALDTLLDTLAIGLDETIWAGGQSDMSLLNYTKEGNLTGSIDLTHSGAGVMFMTVVGYAGGDPPLQLSLFGSCPGRITATVTRAAPGARVDIAYGLREGLTRVPGCPDLALGIENARRWDSILAGPDGLVEVSLWLPSSGCGRFHVQAVERASCRLSNVEGL